MKLERVPVPTPRAGEVLIKVAMSAILPMNMSELKVRGASADAHRLPRRVTASARQATYGTWNKDALKAAVTCGSEGCGTVVESGGGLFAWRKI